MESECIEIVKSFGAETLGTGIALGIVLTILAIMTGRFVIIWILNRLNLTGLKLPK